MADIVINKPCLQCGSQATLQADGTYKCPVCGFVMQGDCHNCDGNQTKG